MTFTQSELVALLHVSNKIILADGKISREEIEQEAFQFFNFGLSFEEILKMKRIKINDSDSFIILSGMSQTKKKYASGYLAMLMKCDGDIPISEMEIWKDINEKCGFPIISAIEAYNFWVDNFEEYD